MKQCTFFLFALLILTSCSNNADHPDNGETNSVPPPVPFINFAVKNYYPHDTSLFTEGLLFHNGQLFESTGADKSVIGITDITTGKFTQKIKLDASKYFGEGIVFFNDKLYQLTYTTQTGFIYDAKTFKQTGLFKFSNKQGWALTTDSTYLVMSDGTADITYLDPKKLTPVKTLHITENGIARDNINELEFIKGFIYANIFKTNLIVKIDPANGKIVGKMDLSSVETDARIKNPGIDVMNGIAYDAATDKIYVTGKMWANIYEIGFPH